MLADLLDVLGLSAGQATLAGSLVMVAMWVRRAKVAGAVAATGIQVLSAVAVVLALGVATGIVGIDVAQFVALAEAFVEVVLGVVDAVAGLGR